ncbi:MAG TPA: DUF4382 domain-containing protein [Gammaproteobacteria bacterium]|nr:DUF4382 domain-containing protein [Gammaproteobacteria bacterium]
MRNLKLFSRLAFAGLALAVLVSGCGGSSSSSNTAVDCLQPANQASTSCAPLVLSLKDTTGDFASYVVTLQQVTLVRDDGLTANVLAAPAKVDFSQLVDASQVMATAYVPSGTYVSMSMTLDYSDADIEAESATGSLVKLAPVDSSGQPLGVTTVTVDLGSGSEITVLHDNTTLASLDFDLAASNTVNLGATPPSVVVSPILYASVNPTDLPTSTAMGTLTGVDLAAGTYGIQVQPLLYLGTKTFGSLTVATSSSTSFEIGGAPFTGSAGLQALAGQAAGTPTLAYGQYSPSDGRFEAEEVYAGSSVPGASLDAVNGSVLSRSGSLLTVRGVVYVQATGTVLYHALVTVTLGSKSVVYKAGEPGTLLTVGDVSVGQRVALLGTLTNTNLTALALDAGSADKGYVRLAPTEVSGTLVSTSAGQIVLNLDEVNHHRVGWYDFTGTGTTSVDDADPSLYQVATGSLSISSLTVGSPAEVWGFVSPFGSAPPDFNAESVGAYKLSGARIMASWRPNGTATPFSVATSSQLSLDLADPDLGPLEVLRRGSDMVALSSLPASPLIEPPSSGLGGYAIRQNGVVTVYVSFSAFVTDLQGRLAAGGKLTMFFATGGYASGTFTATRIAAAIK